jgi:transcriptional regulator with XRE-family HTH domain
MRSVSKVNAVGFAENLGELRRERGLTQAALADRVGVTSNQLSRYELGLSEPSLAALRQLAVALSVSLDDLVFGTDGRGGDDALRLAFESTIVLDEGERDTVVALLEAFVARHHRRRGGEGPRARSSKRR